MGVVLRRVLRPGALVGLLAGGCAEGAPGSEQPTGYWPSTPTPEPDAEVGDASVGTDAGSSPGPGVGVRDSGPPARDSGPLDGGATHDAATTSDASAGADLDASTEPPGEDAGPADAGFHDAAPEGCSAGTTDCAGSCVDLNSDPHHCGACEHACPGGAACDGSGTCTPPNSDCRYAQFQGHDYLFCSDNRTWTQARNRCLGWGLDLAIVDSEAENAFLTEGQSQWLGMSDRDSQAFRWVPAGDPDGVAGNALAYTNWGQDEPNNDRSCEWVIVNCSTEDCGELRSDSTWNDRLCNVEQDYVCESF